MSDFLSDMRYKAWLNRVEKAGTLIERVDLLATVRRGRKAFAGLVDAELVNKLGQRVRRCMMIRGDSVVVVPVIRPIDGNPPYTLMVEQYRPVDGCQTLEFVGGMLEAGQTAEACAVNEVREELGLAIESNQLQLLHPEPIRVCTAMLDDRAYGFMATLAVSGDFREKIDGTSAGDHADGEWICIRAVEFPVAGAQPVFSAQVGLRLLENALGHQFWTKVNPAVI